jgi:hypothetical protein
MSLDRAWEWVRRCVSVGGVPRRWLPGRSSPGRPAAWGRSLAVAVMVEVLDLAVSGCAQAQVLAVFLPTIVLRRGADIPAQVRALVADDLDSVVGPPVPSPSSAVARWCRAISQAREDGDHRRVLALLERGPGPPPAPVADHATWLDRFFPGPSGDVHDEATLWSAAACPHLAAAEVTPAISAREVRQWARAHRSSSGGVTGWAPRLIEGAVSVDASLATLLARLWSLPPAEWMDPGLRRFVWRSSDGWLLPRPGRDKPRPIAAPHPPRRLLSALDARRARPALLRYCERRGQLGLSGGGEKLAYSLLPRLVVALGGDAVVADRDASYQSFDRGVLVSSATAFLSSPEARQEPAAAASFARLMDRCLFEGAHGLPRTEAVFRRAGDDSRVAHALPQGCSSSPSMEALALASAPHAPPPSGVIRLGAHDDLVVASLPSAPPPSVPPPWGGGGYNLSKSAAVGPRAGDALTSGAAASSRAHVTVFGCPVGNVADWVTEVWVPRWQTLLRRLREAFAEAPDAAIAAADAVGGPCSIAAHWLRAFPAATLPSVSAALAAADAEWVALWLEFGGVQRPAPGSISPSSAAHARVFGAGPACLGHRSASASAEALWWSGLSSAWPVVARLGSAAGIPWRDLARAAAVPHTVWAPAGASPEAVTAYCRAAASQAQLALDTGRAALAASLAGSPGAAAGAPGAPNLWVSSLKAASGLVPLPSTPPGVHFSAAGYAVARIFGLPVWSSLGLSSPPSACAHCCAVPAPSLGGCGGGAAPRAPALAPRAVLDAQGEHIGVCLRSGPAAGALRRHNAFCRALADISAACGRGGAYHDGPVFESGPRRRPADWLEAGGPASPAGVCCDATIRTGGVAAAASAEQDKVALYTPQMALHSGLSFAPFGVGTDGSVGPAAHTRMGQWTRSLATTRARRGDLPGDPPGEVAAAVGRAFLRAFAAQAAAWLAPPCPLRSSRVRAAIAPASRPLGAGRAAPARGHISSGAGP